MDRSFTARWDNTQLRGLKTACHVSASSGNATQSRVQYSALWDTGAARSVIAQRIVDRLELKPVRTAHLIGVHGVQETETYSVDVFLPNGVEFYGLEVIKGNPPAFWWDMLIGMDIISRGDFSLKQRGVYTELSFSVP